MNHLRSAFFIAFIAQLCSVGYSNAVAQLLYGILFILWMVIIVREGKLEYHVFDLVFAAFVVVRITTIAFSEYPDASNGTYLREVIFYPYYLIAKYFLTRYGMEGLRTALLWTAGTLLIPSMYAIITVLTGSAERGSSFTGGYMVFAVNAGFIFAFTLALFVTEQKISARRLLGIAAVVILCAIVSTYARAVWISVIVCLIAIGFIGYRRSAAAAMLALSASVLFVPAIRDRLQSLMNPMQNSSGRLELWNTAMQLLPQHPFFGFGPETFNSIIGDRSKLPDQFVASWHNEFFQIQIESGLIGTLLLLMIYGMIVWMVGALRKHMDNTGSKFIFLFGIFTIIIIIPSILTGSVMFSVMNGMLLKFFFAVIVWYSGTVGTIATKHQKVRS